MEPGVPGRAPSACAPTYQFVFVALTEPARGRWLRGLSVTVRGDE